MTNGRIPKMERITVILFGAVYVFQGTTSMSFLIFTTKIKQP